MNSQELRALQEAYSQVYASHEEVDQLDEISDRLATAARNARERRFTKAVIKSDTMYDPRYQTQNAKSKRLNKTLASRAERTGNKIKAVEQVDLYDIILSHLLDEGYADTEQAAEAIMVNMSGDWRESILEEVEQLDEISDKKVIAARNKLAKRTDRSVSALSRRDSFIQDTNREGRMNAKIQARNQRTGSNVEPTFLRRHE
jgi:hypothetical protein